MRPDWREVQKDGVRAQWAGMHVTLNPRGELFMTRRTWELMGGPKGFVVLFDTVNNRIGLKPAAETTRNAYKCGPRGTYGGKLLRVLRLMVDFRIDLPETLEFVNPDRDEDGVLILDLRTAKVSPRAVARGKGPRRGAGN